ncbi:MAG: MATE family efflux transporter [Eubacterium sp.]|nr:MATE family efflux transporter [Eubacterium sp.]
MEQHGHRAANPLGTVPVAQLLNNFAIPSIIAMLVSSLYNIVDQFFIGRSVGELGNAATNITFPLTISCISIALLCGIGGAAAFNLSMGAGDTERAGYYVGNAASIMMTGGVLLAAVTLLFTTPLLRFFGSPEEVLPYALTYSRVCAFGFPFLILSSGGAHLVRADGSPRYTMMVNLTGAVINTILDAAFVFGFHWGMFGAALATIIGQIVAAGLVIRYLMHYKTIPLTKAHFMLRGVYARRLASLGTAPCITQLSLMVFQIVMNKSLKYYGSLSEYGESIPIACVGIISKVSQVAFSFVIGISQGMQPIVSFNYGARKYDRVRQTYLRALRNSAFITVTAFILFQIFPRQIISIFGRGSDLYYKFGVRYFRVFLFFIFLCFLQPMTSNFFTAIGKPKKGIFLSLTRQIIFLVPLVLILPLFMGIDGIMYAGPVADLMAAVSAFLMVRAEFRKPEFTRLQ